MIELYDIIDIICKITKKNLVLHRNITEHRKFKIYKIFSYKLYDIDDNKNILLSLEVIKNVSSDDIYIISKECDKLFLEKLINLLLSNNFKNYNGI